MAVTIYSPLLKLFRFSKSWIFSLAAVVVIGGFLQNSYAAEEIDENLDSRILIDRPLDEIKGTIIDQTITVAGHNFFRSFAEAWRDRPDSGRYNLAIYERPSAAWGSLIWIEYNYRVIHRLFLGARRIDMKEKGEAAAVNVQQAIAEAEVQQAIFIDPDVSKDEL